MGRSFWTAPSVPDVSIASRSWMTTLRELVSRHAIARSSVGLGNCLVSRAALSSLPWAITEHAPAVSRAPSRMGFHPQLWFTLLVSLLLRQPSDVEPL